MPNKKGVSKQFGKGHLFSIHENALIIRKRGLFRTQQVNSIRLKNIIKLEFVRPFDKKNRFKTSLVYLISLVLFFIPYYFLYFDILSRNHALITYKIEEEIAKTRYFANFRPEEFDGLVDTISRQ